MDSEATMELFLGAQSSFLPVVNWFDSLCIEFQVQRMNEMKYSKMYEQIGSEYGWIFANKYIWI